MELVKLGKKGQLSLPAAMYPVEMYSAQRFAWRRKSPP